MFKDTGSQDGFGAIETILVIVIVGLLGFTGWYVLHTKQTAVSTLSATPKSSSLTTKTPNNRALVVQAVKDYKDNASQGTAAVVAVKAIKGDNAYGTVSYKGQDGGGQWLAHKSNGTWAIVSQGSVGFCKDEIQQYNLPSSWEPSPTC